MTALVMCRHKRVEVDCDYCTISVVWAIVKAARDLRDHGHGRAVEWARAWLELENQPTVVATRHPHDPEGAVNQ